MLGGCFTYSSKIDLVNPSGISTVDPDDDSRINETVAAVTSRFGLIPDSRLPEIARSSRQDAEWNEYVQGLYATGPNAATRNRVAVWVLVDKKSGQRSVVIRDLDSVSASRFTATLESSLTDALSKALPSQIIQVQRETVGPAFGP